MSEQTVFLESIHIQNYRSLHDVVIPFRPLTVLVGPNASGKTNFVKSLMRFHGMVKYRVRGDEVILYGWRGGGEDMRIGFELNFNYNGTSARYKIQLRTAQLGTTHPNAIASEELWLGETAVINIHDGQGEVRDEGKNGEITTFKSQTYQELALKSAGNYGNKPITSAINEFIQNWQFYDFDLSLIRKSFDPIEHNPFIANNLIDRQGANFYQTLLQMGLRYPDYLEAVSHSLREATNLILEYVSSPFQDGFFSPRLYLNEGYSNRIGLESASDGTLRLLAYYMLLHSPELPPLITIEEPERSLHPNALLEIARVIEQLSYRTQVIITTHSSQLLDCFNQEDLGKGLGILFLRNHPGQGTEVINLEEVRAKRASLDGWMIDFGLGNAIFNSGLLQDPIES